MTDEKELLRRWKAGDRQAADELLRAHEAVLRRFFATKTEPQVIDELLQRTFVECTAAVHRFREESSFRTFLLVIARRQLYRHVDSRRRRQRLEADPRSLSLHELGLGPGEETMLVAAHRRKLLRALHRIPLELQISLELYYWEGLSTAEIAEVIAVPQGTIKSRLRRAREALEAEMENPGPPQSTTTKKSFRDWARSVRRKLGV